jgi:ammonium transporter, Amt family
LCVILPPSVSYSYLWFVGLGISRSRSCLVKFYLGVDDALDLTAEHAIGGIIGLLFNGFFATNSVIALDGVNTSVVGGFLDSNWKQLYIQIAYIGAVVAYTFVVTALIVKSVDILPGLQLRSSEEGETLGTDDTEVCRLTDFIVQTFNGYSTDRGVRNGLHRSTPPLQRLDSTYR